MGNDWRGKAHAKHDDENSASRTAHQDLRNRRFEGGIREQRNIRVTGELVTEVVRRVGASCRRKNKAPAASGRGLRNAMRLEQDLQSELHVESFTGADTG